MIFRRRPRFEDVISRQLDLFATDHAELLAEADEALSTYDRADRDEAEELYGDYQLVVEAATEVLAEIRDSFRRTLDDDDAAERYEDEFNRAAAKRYPAFGVDLPNT